MTSKIKPSIKYKIEELKAKEVSDEFWGKYFAYSEKLAKELNPDDPVPDRNQRIKDLKSTFPKHFRKNWLVYSEDEKIIGGAVIFFPEKDSPQFKKNPYLIDGSIAVDHDYRRQGIGTELLKILIKIGIDHKRTTIETEIGTELGKAFTLAMGGTIALDEAENRLQYSDIDWNLMER